MLARTELTARTLMRGNRVLIALLLLWPCVLSAILLGVERGRPAAEDIAAILQQELIYGLVLVGLGGSVALGTELRAHRVQGVLGRAVGRGEYLLALAISAFVPFAAYVLVWLVNAAVFTLGFHLHLPPLGAAVAAELSAGVLICAVGLLFSTFLTQMVAAVATGLVLGALAAAGAHGVGGVAGAFGFVEGAVRTGPGVMALGACVLAGLVVFAGAVALFARKDLKRI